MIKIASANIAAGCCALLLAACGARPHPAKEDAQTVRAALEACSADLRKLPDAFGDAQLTLLYLDGIKRDCKPLESEDTCERALYWASIAGNSYRIGHLGEVDAALTQFASNHRRCLADLNTGS